MSGQCARLKGFEYDKCMMKELVKEMKKTLKKIRRKIEEEQ